MYQIPESKIFISSPSNILSYLAFLISGVVISVLCELNRYPWNQNMILQNITAACFCLYSAALYVVYMVVTAFLKLVLRYAGSVTYFNPSSDYSYPEHELLNGSISWEDLEEDSVNLTEPKNEEEECQKKTNSWFPNISSLKRKKRLSVLWNNFVQQHIHAKPHVRRYSLPRSIIISSMYLGGSGAFLSILPLCMWDFTMSASFICSLLFISCIDAKPIPKDFKPDVDVASTTRNLKWLRFGYHMSAFISLLIILWIDTREEIIYYIIPMITTSSFPQFLEKQVSVNNQTSQPETYLQMSENKVLLEGRTGLSNKWPLIMLSASSPILLRAGCGGVGNFFFSLPPSQTLETGLPVSTILAILVVCWHNPSESIVQDFLGIIDYKTAIPLFIICPMCICAALAFILYGFKTRASGIIAILLLIILCIRQQILPAHHMQSTLDWTSLSSVLNTLACLVWYTLYKRSKVLEKHKMRTWDKEPLLIVEEEALIEDEESMNEKEDINTPKTEENDNLEISDIENK